MISPNIVIDEQKVYSIFGKIFEGIQASKEHKHFLDKFNIKECNFEKLTYINQYKDVYSGFIAIDQLLYKFNFFISLDVEKVTVGQASEASKMDQTLFNCPITHDAAIDEKNILERLTEIGKLDPDIFKVIPDKTYPIRVDFTGIVCNDVPFAEFLIIEIGLKEGFITQEDFEYIAMPFGLSGAVKIPEVENAMSNQFETTFKILKDNGHTFENEYEYNDADNYLFYAEEGNLRCISYKSQNTLFTVIKNDITGEMKAWLSMCLIDDWYEYVSMDILDEDTSFNLCEYMEALLSTRYSINYDHPIAFEHPSHLKDYKYHMANFDENGLHCVYDSKKGFNPKEYIIRNALIFNMDVGDQNLHSDYDIEYNGVHIEH